MSGYSHVGHLLLFAFVLCSLLGCRSTNRLPFGAFEYSKEEDWTKKVEAGIKEGTRIVYNQRYSESRGIWGTIEIRDLGSDTSRVHEVDYAVAQDRVAAAADSVFLQTLQLEARDRILSEFLIVAANAGSPFFLVVGPHPDSYASGPDTKTTNMEDNAASEEQGFWLSIIEIDDTGIGPPIPLDVSAAGRIVEALSIDLDRFSSKSDVLGELNGLDRVFRKVIYGPFVTSEGLGFLLISDTKKCSWVVLSSVDESYGVHIETEYSPDGLFRKLFKTPTFRDVTNVWYSPHNGEYIAIEHLPSPFIGYWVIDLKRDRWKHKNSLRHYLQVTAVSDNAS
jgi:hypothetical protein